MENKKERIELGCHTKMSEIYGLNTIGEYIDEAIARGNKAIGITDINSVQSFIEAQHYLDTLENREFKVIYGLRARFVDDKEMNEKSEIYDIVIYVKEQVGLKNLYTLLSKAYTNMQDNEPIIFKSQLDKYREGLLYGTVGKKGELYQSIYLNKPEIDKIAKYYDFLEIEPLYDCSSEDERNKEININKKILEVGTELNIIVKSIF